MKNKLKATLVASTLIALVVPLTSCNDADTIDIGILQLATHPALSQVNQGFQEVLNEAGEIDGQKIVFNTQNPEGDLNILQTMAANLTSNSDLLLGIATDASVGLKNAVKRSGKTTPVLFSAVTDPIDAGLVEDNNHPGANVTGASDMGPVEEAISLLETYFGDKIEKVGLAFNASESNSIQQINLAKATIEENGWTWVERSFTSVNETKLNIGALLNEGIDALYIPTDNLIASSINEVKAAIDASSNKPIVLVGESNQLSGAGILSLGVDYLKLGQAVGEIALEILNGKKPGDIPVYFQTDCLLSVNQTLATAWGIELPASLLAVADEII